MLFDDEKNMKTSRVVGSGISVIEEMVDRVIFEKSPELSVMDPVELKTVYGDVSQRIEKSLSSAAAGGESVLTRMTVNKGGNSEKIKEILKRRISKKINVSKTSDEKERRHVEKRGESTVESYRIPGTMASVKIVYSSKKDEKKYLIFLDDLKDEEKKVFDFIVKTLEGMNVSFDELEKVGPERYLTRQIHRIIDEYNLELKKKSVERVVYFLKRNLLGLGKIEELMKDRNVENISCDGPGIPVFVYHNKHGFIKTNIVFKTEDELSGFVLKLAQKCNEYVSVVNPIVEGHLSDRSSVHMTYGSSVTPRGSTFTINKFRSDPLTPIDLVENNIMSVEMMAYFWLVVEHGFNAIITGENNTGKTTVLNAISLFIPRNAKIISVEKNHELNLPHPNWVPEITHEGLLKNYSKNIDVYDAMKAAARQRPNYLIVGDIQEREAYLFFQTMSTGQTAFSTFFAHSAQDLIHRLEEKPINLPRIMLGCLDLICVQTSTYVKKRRLKRCKKIIEVIDIDPKTGEVLTNEVFTWDPIEDKFIYSGKSYLLEQIRKKLGINVEDLKKEINKRTSYLTQLSEEEMRNFKKFVEAIGVYNKKIKNKDEKKEKHRKRRQKKTC